MREDVSLFVSAKHLDEADKKVWLRTLVRRLFEKWLVAAFYLNRCDYFGRRKRTCLSCDRLTANRGDAYCLVRDWRKRKTHGRKAQGYWTVVLLCFIFLLCNFIPTTEHTKMWNKNKPFNLFRKQIITCAAHEGAVSLHRAGRLCVLVCWCLSTVAWKKTKPKNNNKRRTAAMSQREIPVDLIRTCCSWHSLFIEFNSPCPAQMTHVFFCCG